MDLGRVATKFATNTYDGFDGTAWTKGVGKCAVEVYSRFITDRLTGVLKRVLLTPTPIPSKYPLIRLPDGKLYIRGYEASDIAHETVYGYIYVVQEADKTATIVNYTKAESASGMGGELVEVLTEGVPVFITRYGGDKAGEELDFMTYTKMLAVLPSYVTLEEGSEMDIEGSRYVVKDLSNEMQMTMAFVGRK